MLRNHHNNSTKVAITGRSGFGKSTLQRQLIRAHQAEYKFTYDHKGEFALYLPCKFSATNLVEFNAALQQTKFVNFNPGALVEECKVYIAGHKSATEKDPRKMAFSKWCKLVFNTCQNLPGKKLIAFDECGRLVTRTAAYALHPLNDIMETGREFGIDVVIAAQRPTHLCRDMRGQVSNWLLFNMPGGWTTALVQDYEEDFSRASKLPQGNYISFDTDRSVFGGGSSIPDR